MTGLRRYAFALGPLAAAALWGGMYVVSKWGFSFVPPLTLGFLRVALGAVALWVVVRAGGGVAPRRADGAGGGADVAGRDAEGGAGGESGGEGPERAGIDSDDWPAFVALGGWVTLTIATQFLGTELTNASQGSLLTVLTPVFTVGLGAAVLGERVTGRKAAGIALAGVGTAVVLAGQYDLAQVAAGNAVGVGLLLVASAAWAGYTVWGVPVVRKYSALTAATYSTVTAVPMLGLLSVAELLYLDVGLADVPLGPASAFAVAYLGLASTAAAWYLWYKGLEFVPAGSVAVFFFAQPVVGAALGAILLEESLGAGFVVGGALMAVGIWVVSRERVVEA